MKLKKQKLENELERILNSQTINSSKKVKKIKKNIKSNEKKTKEVDKKIENVKKISDRT